jgi:hypothetical protein
MKKKPPKQFRFRSNKSSKDYHSLLLKKKER